MNASLHRCERHLVLMMNVGDDRHRRTRHNLGEAFSCFNFVTGAPHDVTTGSSEGVNLLQSAFNISGLGDGH